MAPYEASYGQKCRSPISWFDVSETKLLGLELVQQAVEKVKLIQERLLTAQRRQKSYSDNRRRDLKFAVGDWVFLKLEAVHPVFHVSMLRKCLGDPSCITPIEDIQVTEDLSYEEVPVAILDRQVRKLRNKEIASVKVFWLNLVVWPCVALAIGLSCLKGFG
ncbi:uncharacterized protein LOC132608039 [Lycium barbarum]|uniref:uncharacterized protein LOC132608039 n=1 Tax=Lycium barbarum TaxID=112863 RepID=UPI00293EA6F1|nr:uncharacterized protein LOC132608039 [Lycium barbarum]